MGTSCASCAFICTYPFFLYFRTVIDTFKYHYYYCYIMDEIKTKVGYIEERVVRADNTIMLGLKMIGNSGLELEEKVQVSTKIGSGKIVIERMKKGGN